MVKGGGEGFNRYNPFQLCVDILKDLLECFTEVFVYVLFDSRKMSDALIFFL